ncbi:MAG TPA: SGNH/GDSL hydrolase family protein [Chthoniobacteraceae bacterium]|nr:SGNH/GDSL hydrolase family protein [Chthoniobacteraceae bacterium]
MKHFRRSLSSLVLTLLLVGTGPSSAFAALYSGLVAFGDSLTDQGNTISYFPPPGGASLTGYDSNYYNAAYNTYDIAAHGRWSDGPTWIEYFYGNLQSGATGAAPVALGLNWGISGTTDISGGTNFAYGGSTTATGSTEVFIHNLQHQVSDYLSLIANSGSALYNAPVSTTLYSVWSGGNDAIYWIEDKNNTPNIADAGTKAAESVNHIQTALTTLYDAGARHFLVPNLPDLGKKPNYLIDPTKAALATAFVNAYNGFLEDAILDLETTYTDISITLFDVHAQLNLLLADPAAYGFLESELPAYVYTGGDPTSTIVADPTTYVFWDYTHPTTQVHQLLGNYAYLAMIPEPSGAALFLAGASLLVVLRHRSGAKRRRVLFS